VKTLRKSVNICQSYRKNKSGTFFYGPQCILASVTMEQKSRAGSGRTTTGSGQKATVAITISEAFARRLHNRYVIVELPSTRAYRFVQYRPR